MNISRSLGFSSKGFSFQSSLRIEGNIEGEDEYVYRSPGLSGPLDFAKPISAYEPSLKFRSSSEVVTRSRFLDSEDSAVTSDLPEEGRAKAEKPVVHEDIRVEDEKSGAVLQWSVRINGDGNEGLAGNGSHVLLDAETVGNGGAGEGLGRTVLERETSDGAGSFSTFINDDLSNSTTKFVISPNGRFKKKIKSWMRGNLLGSGSFGTVYEGICDDGTFIAVKEVSLLGNNAQQCILLLEQEIALLSQFEHKNIVQYYGTDKETSKLFIFLELVTQGSIASLYQKYRLRDTQVSSYTRQILNGLNYLHECDVVHRDIKCANILVHANGSIKLADFGLAKEISKFNALKSCKGSVYWMAPEVIHPEKTYGRAADIWSLGCTVLEMLTRQNPYPNMEWQQAAFKIHRGVQPNIPRELSSDAQDFIRRCVQVDPDARPTAAQLLEHPFVTRPLDLSLAQSLSTSFQAQDLLPEEKS